MPPREDLPEGLVPERDKHPEHEEAILLRDAMIAGLAGAASDVAEVGRQLYKATVLTKVQRMIMYATLLIVAMSLVGLYVVALGNKHNGDLIVDCTQPGGVCYERGQQATADAIKTLVTQGEAAAYCSPRSQAPADYKSCIVGYARGVAAGGSK